MPELLFVIFFIICLGAAAAALMLAYQLTRDYQADFLNHYFYYLMAYMVFGLYGLWGQLIVRYLLEQLDSKSSVVEAMASLLPLFGIPFLLVTYLMLMKIALSFAGKSISSIGALIYFLAMTVLLGLAGWGLSSSIDLPDLELNIYMGLELLFYLVFLAVMLLSIKTIQDVKRQSIYRNFSWLLFLGLVLRIALLQFLPMHFLVLAGFLLLYFVGNVVPLWFLRLKADQLFPSYTADLATENHFEQLCRQHHISKREAEIMKLICQGKTNQEIADALFITLQTVKDHNHRIYTKIGIRSRVQLINLVK